MNRDQLKEALTGMGVSFANNASTEKLQALYDGALAAKAAGGEIPKEGAPDGEAAPEGNSGSAPDAGPAEGPAPAGADPDAEAPAPSFVATLAEDDLEAEIGTKVRAGLTRAQAIEVIRNQQEHDEALGLI